MREGRDGVERAVYKLMLRSKTRTARRMTARA